MTGGMKIQPLAEGRVQIVLEVLPKLVDWPKRAEKQEVKRGLVCGIDSS